MMEHMARRQVLVQLDDDLVAALDAEAARGGFSRSELIRRGARRILEDARIEELERRHEEGYRRVPVEEGEFPDTDPTAWPPW